MKNVFKDLEKILGQSFVTLAREEQHHRCFEQAHQLTGGPCLAQEDNALPSLPLLTTGSTQDSELDTQPEHSCTPRLPAPEGIVHDN